MHSVAKILEARPDASRETMVWISGGTFMMGSDYHFAEESPAHPVTVTGFWMDRHEVTNAEFAAFVRETGYVTRAERVSESDAHEDTDPQPPEPGSRVFRKPPIGSDLRNHVNWWSFVPGASWRHPGGPGTTLDGLDRHPVVHIAWEDAQAYAAWAGKQLPTEAEWEFAARGGLDAKEFAWGDELMPNGAFMANTWQGEFPLEDLALDGHAGTSPVGAFPPNGYGLYDMIGNVWEWTRDWYGRHVQSADAHVRRAGSDSRPPEERNPRKVVKGGSYLCAPNSNQRYRPAARMAQPLGSTSCQIGFRCIIRP